MGGRRFGGRTLARSHALQLLFQAEATDRLVSEVLDGGYALEEGPLEEYGRELALGVDAHRHELDAVLAATSERWGVGRMPGVDRNLLRIALYEMLFVDNVDTPVAIDECVELAKAYGTDDSSRFVNGLLGKVARRMDAGQDVVGIALAAAAAVDGDQAEGSEQGPDDTQTDAIDVEGSDAVDADVEPPASEAAEEGLPDWVRE